MKTLHMALTIYLKFGLKNLSRRIEALVFSVDSAKKHKIDAATYVSAGRNTS